MNDNQNDKKSLDCSLYCKSTASLANSILNDLSKEDKPLSELLKEDKYGDEDSREKVI